jgi:peptidoglycan hydrolase-like protein with peptidoglycan-binding domain
MKQLMLATVASLALSLPVMAQSNNTHTMQPNSQSQMNTPSSQNSDQAQDQSQSQDQSANQQAQNEINPSQLDRQQIRHIQSALDQKGFNVHRVDGKWGPETEAALKKFQQKQNLQDNGQLDQQTLGALGVNVNGSAQQGSATTGSGSHENGMNQSSQNPGMTNSDQSGQTTGQGADTTGQGHNNGTQQINQSPGQSSGSTGNSAGSTSK